MAEDVFDKLKKNKEKAEDKDTAVNDVNGDGDGDGDGIALTRKTETERLKRTYYLDPKQENNINWASRKTGRDKSEIVRLALDYFFENVEVD